MKKFVAMMFVVFMIIGTVITASANDDPIWDDVYKWWIEANTNEYNMFKNTDYYSDGFVVDNVAYYAGYNASLTYNEFMTMDQLNKHIDDSCKRIGLKDYTYTINRIGYGYKGKCVLRITINTTEDLTKIPEAYCNFKDPIYGMVLICYDRITVD